jgi:hypothetical protein
LFGQKKSPLENLTRFDAADPRIWGITEKYYHEELDEDKVKVAMALNEVLSKQPEGPVPQCPANSNRPKLILIKTKG